METLNFSKISNWISKLLSVNRSGEIFTFNRLLPLAMKKPDVSIALGPFFETVVTEREGWMWSHSFLYSSKGIPYLYFSDWNVSLKIQEIFIIIYRQWFLSSPTSIFIRQGIITYKWSTNIKHKGLQVCKRPQTNMPCAERRIYKDLISYF